MWHDDHPPPHIHVEYQGFEALVQIETGQILKGKLPKKVASIINEWCETHRSELLENWNRAQRFETLERIRGADHD
ncbi:protein of unknown function [Allochromatium warmingii]|uniref:DUF4160 domain-containing protein n=2 Tax=Allochromatium warmingii TaxID=61595 RepID=A0A1H3JBN6_ALLWA|nr:protein of unknown function [Allochromatium warmingii]